MEKYCVLIVDDHKLVRETWRYVINSDPRFIVVADCGNSEVAMQLANKFEPHLVLMDITLPPDSGFTATARIKRLFPRIKVIGFTMHAREPYLRKMLECGADGYVTKNSPKEELIEALVASMEGKQFICAEMRPFLSEAA